MSKSMYEGKWRFLRPDDPEGECLEMRFLNCAILLEVGTLAWAPINCAIRLEVGAWAWVALLTEGLWEDRDRGCLDGCVTDEPLWQTCKPKELLVKASRTLCQRTLAQMAFPPLITRLRVRTWDQDPPGVCAIKNFFKKRVIYSSKWLKNTK